jgi:hypothetical protein
MAWSAIDTVPRKYFDLRRNPTTNYSVTMACWIPREIRPLIVRPRSIGKHLCHTKGTRRDVEELAAGEAAHEKRQKRHSTFLSR